jgi:hypothetical protein
MKTLFLVLKWFTLIFCKEKIFHLALGVCELLLHEVKHFHDTKKLNLNQCMLSEN